MELQPDADLIRRFLGGDSQAGALVDDWIAGASWPFRRRLSSEWEDLLQEIRLEVVRLLQAGRFRGESRLKTYLWQVAAHMCVDAVRRQRYRSFVDLDAVAEQPAATASPFEALAEQEGAAAALCALAAVPAECRELWRQLLRGLSYREIGRALGASEGTLRVRAHRCRKSAVDAYRAITASAPPKGVDSAVP